jgi:hypothetical protein
MLLLSHLTWAAPDCFSDNSHVEFGLITEIVLFFGDGTVRSCTEAFFATIVAASVATLQDLRACNSAKDSRVVKRMARMRTKVSTLESCYAFLITAACKSNELTRVMDSDRLTVI